MTAIKETSVPQGRTMNSLDSGIWKVFLLEIEMRPYLQSKLAKIQPKSL